MNPDLRDYLLGEKNMMVLDVESMGLHGDAFAFGYAIFHKGEVIASAEHSIPREAVVGLSDDKKWIDANVPLMIPDLAYPHQLREIFWKGYLLWRQVGCLVAADCPWPVEAKFLHQCIADDLANRRFMGPYPIYDLMSLGNLMSTNYNLTLGKPKGHRDHHPLDDAIHSGKCFWKQLNDFEESKYSD